MAEADMFPSRIGMAGLAFFTIAALMGAIFAVIFAMARHAGQRRVLEILVVGVAFFAAGIGVLSAKWEFCFAVIELDLCPVLLGVTIGALRAERTVVLVILAMADNAGGFELVAVKMPGVAAFAFGGAMLEVQRVFRGPVMVENAFLPIRGVMADLALLAEAALVLVVRAVATDTRQRCALEVAGLVARVARDLDVLVEQLEARLVVIKARFLPVGLCMTVRTF